MGINSRIFAEKHFDTKSFTEKYISLIKSTKLKKNKKKSNDYIYNR